MHEGTIRDQGYSCRRRTTFCSFHIKVGEEEYNCQGDKSSIRSYDYRMGTKTFLVIDCFVGLVPEKPF